MIKNIFSGNYLYLRRSFHEGLRSDAGDAGDWERLPLAYTLQKLRLENTKVSPGPDLIWVPCVNWPLHHQCCISTLIKLRPMEIFRRQSFDHVFIPQKFKIMFLIQRSCPSNILTMLQWPLGSTIRLSLLLLWSEIFIPTRPSLDSVNIKVSCSVKWIHSLLTFSVNWWFYC